VTGTVLVPSMRVLRASATYLCLCSSKVTLLALSSHMFFYYRHISMLMGAILL